MVNKQLYPLVINRILVKNYYENYLAILEERTQERIMSR